MSNAQGKIFAEYLRNAGVIELLVSLLVEPLASIVQHSLIVLGNICSVMFDSEEQVMEQYQCCQVQRADGCCNASQESVPECTASACGPFAARFAHLFYCEYTQESKAALMECGGVEAIVNCLDDAELPTKLYACAALQVSDPPPRHMPIP